MQHDLCTLLLMEQSSTVGNSSHPPLISDITKTHTQNAFSDCFDYTVFFHLDRLPQQTLRESVEMEKNSVVKTVRESVSCVCVFVMSEMSGG